MNEQRANEREQTSERTNKYEREKKEDALCSITRDYKCQAALFYFEEKIILSILTAFERKRRGHEHGENTSATTSHCCSTRMQQQHRQYRHRYAYTISVSKLQKNR